MRMLDAKYALPLFYLVFLLAGGFWLWQKAKFCGVEHWPTVDAEILRVENRSIPFIRAWYTGTQTGSVDASSVTFRYVVNGKIFESSLATPNGGGVPPRYGRHEYESWKAFYKPGSPEVAVLSPVPYTGILLLAVASTCAIPVGVHLYFWSVEVIGQFLRRRQGRRTLEL